jgi:glycerophosphoryl diester phosphodiesterase
MDIITLDMETAYAKDFSDLLNIFLYQADVDGVFSDFPDKAVDAIKAHGKS